MAPAAQRAISVGDQLFEEWRVYEKLLIHDYMDHRAFFARLQAEILQRLRRPIAILDLGCGDLAPILPLLEAVPVRRYVGVDESAPALALAADRLGRLTLSGELIQDDLLAALEGTAESFDLVLASFSLHHLADPADKLRVLQGAGRVLVADGFIALIDVFSAADESREGYLARWITHADLRYQALQPAEKTLLFNHVRARDFPLSLDAWRAFAAQAGLPRVDVLLEDHAGLNRLVTFNRASAPGRQR
jgi:SAM-dependent methyltransferase